MNKRVRSAEPHVTTTLRLPASLLAKLDETADGAGISRTQTIIHACGLAVDWTPAAPNDPGFVPAGEDAPTVQRVVGGQVGNELTVTIDEADAPRISANRWRRLGAHLVRSAIIDGKSTNIRAHEQLLGVETPVLYANGDPCDLRRANLLIPQEVKDVIDATAIGQTDGVPGVEGDDKKDAPGVWADLNFE